MKTDIELRDDVLNELRWEPAVDAAEIGVAVKSGVVTLSGMVDYYREKLESEHAVLRVSEVRALVNQVEIRWPSPNLPTDMDIAEAVLNALEWDVNVPEGRIKAMVEAGWVTLRGNVDGQDQKTAANAALRDLKGIKGVINEIEVELTGDEVKEGSSTKGL